MFPVAGQDYFFMARAVGTSGKGEFSQVTFALGEERGSDKAVQAHVQNASCLGSRLLTIQGSDLHVHAGKERELYKLGVCNLGRWTGCLGR